MMKFMQLQTSKWNEMFSTMKHLPLQQSQVTIRAS